jgi:biotin synthase
LEVFVFETYSRLAERALAGDAPSQADALWILTGQDVELLPLLHAAFVPRRHHFGRRVSVQVLNNIQNGLCSEDCGYCAQGKGSESDIREYRMKADEQIFSEAERAARAGASRYCMALSGRGPGIERTRHLARLIRELKSRYPIEICLSAGLMDDPCVRVLSEAGLDRLNHNLNTSEAHYGKICSTHGYGDRLATLEAAKRHGLAVCSGFILGMGETSHDVVEVAFKLRELETPSIPVNFLIPIEGNRITDDSSLTPERCLRALCLLRFVNPAAEIRVAGGREGHLRSMQALSLYPANSLFVGGYLTTRGDGTRETYTMIEDAGFEIEGNPLYDRESHQHGSGFRTPGGAEELLRPELAPR